MSAAKLLRLAGVRGLIDEAGGLVLLRAAADEAEILTLATMQQAPERRKKTFKVLQKQKLRAGRESLCYGSPWIEAHGSPRRRGLTATGAVVCNLHSKA